MDPSRLFRRLPNAAVVLGILDIIRQEILPTGPIPGHLKEPYGKMYSRWKDYHSERSKPIISLGVWERLIGRVAKKIVLFASDGEITDEVIDEMATALYLEVAKLHARKIRSEASLTALDRLSAYQIINLYDDYAGGAVVKALGTGAPRDVIDQYSRNYNAALQRVEDAGYPNIAKKIAAYVCKADTADEAVAAADHHVDVYKRIIDSEKLKALDPKIIPTVARDVVLSSTFEIAEARALEYVSSFEAVVAMLAGTDMKGIARTIAGRVCICKDSELALKKARGYADNYRAALAFADEHGMGQVASELANHSLSKGKATTLAKMGKFYACFVAVREHLVGKGRVNISRPVALATCRMKSVGDALVQTINYISFYDAVIAFARRKRASKFAATLALASFKAASEDEALSRAESLLGSRRMIIRHLQRKGYGDVAKYIAGEFFLNVSDPNVLTEALLCAEIFRDVVSYLEGKGRKDAPSIATKACRAKSCKDGRALADIYSGNYDAVEALTIEEGLGDVARFVASNSFSTRSRTKALKRATRYIGNHRAVRTHLVGEGFTTIAKTVADRTMTAADVDEAKAWATGIAGSWSRGEWSTAKSSTSKAVHVGGGGGVGLPRGPVERYPSAWIRGSTISSMMFSPPIASRAHLSRFSFLGTLSAMRPYNCMIL